MKIQGLDSPLSRLGTNCVKWDTCAENELPLWVADMDFAYPECISQAIQKRLEHPILGYSFAPSSWQSAVRQWVFTQQGWHVENIMALQGVMSGLHGAILAGGKAGDKILIQTPVYHPFASIPDRLERTVIEAPLAMSVAGQVNSLGERAVYCTFDFQNLEKAMSDPLCSTALISSPHNPGGRVWTRADLLRLGEMAYVHGVTLIIDEIHADTLRVPGSFLSFGRLLAEKAWGSEVPEAVVIQAPTKTFNIAGISSAWAVASNEALFSRMDRIVRGLGTEVLNILSYVAAEAVYRDGLPWLERVREAINTNLAWLQAKVHDYNLNRRNAGLAGSLAASIPEASYLYWLYVGDLGVKDSRHFVQDLRNDGVRFNPGAQFGTGGEGFIRINVACHPETLGAAWQKLVARLG